MIQPVTVRGVTLGEGRPKICMPLVASGRARLEEAAREAGRLLPDLVEWRADHYEGLKPQEVTRLLDALRALLPQMPVLFTFRSEGEGGARPLAVEQRRELMEAAIAAGADLLDAELSLGDALPGLLDAAHARGIPAIVSSHDFTRTPSAGEMVDILRREQDCGGDIVKLAVMPRSPADVLALLEATNTMRERYARAPLATMSMGALGLPSRVCGGTFGSALTFGAGSAASAPGQPGVAELRALLGLLGA